MSPTKKQIYQFYAGLVVYLFVFQFSANFIQTSYLRHSPVMIGIFGMLVGVPCFIVGLRHDEVSKLWTLLFGVAVLVAFFYGLHKGYAGFS